MDLSKVRCSDCRTLCTLPERTCPTCHRRRAEKARAMAGAKEAQVKARPFAEQYPGIAAWAAPNDGQHLLAAVNQSMSQHLGHLSNLANECYGNQASQAGAIDLANVNRQQYEQNIAAYNQQQRAFNKAAVQAELEALYEQQRLTYLTPSFKVSQDADGTTMLEPIAAKAKQVNLGDIGRQQYEQAIASSIGQKQSVCLNPQVYALLQNYVTPNGWDLIEAVDSSMPDELVPVVAPVGRTIGVWRDLVALYSANGRISNSYPVARRIRLECGRTIRVVTDDDIELGALRGHKCWGPDAPPTSVDRAKAEPVREAEAPRFKVGDWVRSSKQYNVDTFGKVGKAVELGPRGRKDLRSDDVWYVIDGCLSPYQADGAWLASPSELELVRKAGEFRRGDKVRIQSGVSGEIEEIANHRGHCIKVRYDSHYACWVTRDGIEFVEPAL